MKQFILNFIDGFCKWIPHIFSIFSLVFVIMAILEAIKHNYTGAVYNMLWAIINHLWSRDDYAKIIHKHK